MAAYQGKDAESYLSSFESQILQLQKIDFSRNVCQAAYQIRKRDNYIEHLKEQLKYRDEILRDKLKSTNSIFLTEEESNMECLKVHNTEEKEGLFPQIESDSSFMSNVLKEAGESEIWSMKHKKSRNTGSGMSQDMRALKSGLQLRKGPTPKLIASESTQSHSGHKASYSNTSIVMSRGPVRSGSVVKNSQNMNLGGSGGGHTGGTYEQPSYIKVVRDLSPERLPTIQPTQGQASRLKRKQVNATMGERQITSLMSGGLTHNTHSTHNTHNKHIEAAYLPPSDAELFNSRGVKKSRNTFSSRNIEPPSYLLSSASVSGHYPLNPNPNPNPQFSSLVGLPHGNTHTHNENSHQSPSTNINNRGEENQQVRQARQKPPQFASPYWRKYKMRTDLVIPEVSSRPYQVGPPSTYFTQRRKDQSPNGANSNQKKGKRGSVGRVQTKTIDHELLEGEGNKSMMVVPQGGKYGASKVTTNPLNDPAQLIHTYAAPKKLQTTKSHRLPNDKHLNTNSRNSNLNQKAKTEKKPRADVQLSISLCNY